MADRKQLSDDELKQVLLRSAAAADLGRAAGLELAGELARIRAEQAKIEGARLRYKRGKAAPEATLPEAAAKARAERGEAAAKLGAVAKQELAKAAKKLGERQPPQDRVPAPAPGPAPGPSPGPVIGDSNGAAGFVIKGKVIEGREGVLGLAVEARTESPLKTVARTTSGEAGAFLIEIANVKQLKQELGLTNETPLMLVLVALKERRIVARSEGAIEAKPGESASGTIKIG